MSLLSESILSAYLDFNRGDVSSLERKNMMLCGISMVVFRARNFSGVFPLSLSGKARFLSVV